MEQLQESIIADSAVAEAMKLMQDGDALLRAAIFDEELPNIDAAHEAIFIYRLAIVSLNDADVDEFRLQAELYFKCGHAYHNIVKDDARAILYFEDVLDTVEFTKDIGRHYYIGAEWSTKAMEFIKVIEKKKKPMVFNEGFCGIVPGRR